MQIKIIRPFNLVTIFWNYKIDINGNVLIINKSGSTVVEVDDSELYNIEVSCKNYFKAKAKIIDKKCCNAIEIKPIINNFSFILSHIAMGALLAVSIMMENNHYLYGGILVYSLLGIVLFDIYIGIIFSELN